MKPEYILFLAAGATYFMGMFEDDKVLRRLAAIEAWVIFSLAFILRGAK